MLRTWLLSLLMTSSLVGLDQHLLRQNNDGLIARCQAQRIGRGDRTVGDRVKLNVGDFYIGEHRTGGMTRPK